MATSKQIMSIVDNLEKLLTNGKDDAMLRFGLGSADQTGVGMWAYTKLIKVTLNGEKVGHSRGYPNSFKHSGGAPNMFVARCVWGKTAKEVDTVEIYRVFDAPNFEPVFVEKPVAWYKGVIDQKKFDRFITQHYGAFDELRIGTTLHSVMAGTKPLRTGR